MKCNCCTTKEWPTIIIATDTASPTWNWMGNECIASITSMSCTTSVQRIENWVEVKIAIETLHKSCRSTDQIYELRMDWNKLGQIESASQIHQKSANHTTKWKRFYLLSVCVNIGLILDQLVWCKDEPDFVSKHWPFTCFSKMNLQVVI